MIRVGRFKLETHIKPKGDQPKAIEEIVGGINRNNDFQTLLGVTGSGKTFTIANVIERINRPALVMAPNKTLAAQLANEFREFFPDNAVEYFVSYYDYYQPEAYIPHTDTYIEKDSAINDEIDRLRHSATSALLSRSDVIIVASVSCIYGLGSTEDYMDRVIPLQINKDYDIEAIFKKLVELKYSRNDIALERGKFRARGDTVEIIPAFEEYVIRLEFFGTALERITRVNPITGEIVQKMSDFIIYPASHFVTKKDKLERAIISIEKELEEQLKVLKSQNKLLEEQRLRMRTNYDLEMIKETGFCQGIENYSRHLSGKAPGEPPDTLLSYFPEGFITFIDESHLTVPQIHGMYGGDFSRKSTLVEHGFRLPSALDNRPLKFEEFLERVGQLIFVSATPGPYEFKVSKQVSEQIIRPTGLVDPGVIVRSTRGQVDNLIEEIKKRVSRNERVLVTTLTKKMAEGLADYLFETGIKVRYMHSDVETTKRIEILTDLRKGNFDVLVGINLLREGLDLPEVSLVAILDADKEGFLRSERSLIQTIGRAARNVDGQVIMYADNVTGSMKRAIDETQRRRQLQQEYNEANGIEPTTIRKSISDILQTIRVAEDTKEYEHFPSIDMGEEAVHSLIQELEEEMHLAAANLNFEHAAELRDKIAFIKKRMSKRKKLRA